MLETEHFKRFVFMSGDGSARAPAGCASLQVDVTGKPRRTKVSLPAAILGSKPRSVPNQQVPAARRAPDVSYDGSTSSLSPLQFLSVDEAVRRKCRTVSLTNPDAAVRGFRLAPSSVHFGTLQEGTSSAVTVRMKNVGVDSCR